MLYFVFKCRYCLLDKINKKQQRNKPPLLAASEIWHEFKEFTKSGRRYKITPLKIAMCNN